MKTQPRIARYVRRAISASVVLAIGWTTTGCEIRNGSGEIGEQSRSTGSFDGPARVEICCGFELELSQGTQSSLVLRGDDNLLDAIEVDRDDDTISIRWEDELAIHRPTRPVQIDLVLPDVRGVASSGGGTVRFGEFEGQSDLEIELSAASEFHAAVLEVATLELGSSGGSRTEIDELDARELSLDLSGGSAVEAAGTAELVEAHLSGGSELRARDLMTVEGDFHLSGGSGAEVVVLSRLVVDASGGSELTYSGDPETSFDTSGGAEISRSSDGPR